MKFVNPGFLLALISIAIPIIIHLFNFRKFKQVYFTNVRFLKEVKQETQSKSKLKHLLVLLARILTIFFIVLAFAQPYIPNKKSNITSSANTVSIYIDNSFSMDAMGKNGSLLVQAKTFAKEIIKAYRNTDKFQLITNDFEGRHQRLVSKEEMPELIDEVITSANVKPINEVIIRQKDIIYLTEENNKKIYLISDFQKSIAQLNYIHVDTGININLIPLTAQQRNNIFIDSCWIESPIIQLNKNIELKVRIKNLSTKNIENNPLKLFINNSEKTPASFSVNENESTVVTLYFTLKSPGIQNCRLEINDYPVSFDDVFYFTLSVNKSIPVLSITDNEGNNYLKSLFGTDSLFTFNEMNLKNINYSSFINSKLIILNNLNEIPSGLSIELKRFVENGGSLIVFPGTEINLDSYKDFSKTLSIATYDKLDTSNTRVVEINYEHEIFKDVFENKNKNIDLPAINQHYPILSNIISRQSYLMKTQKSSAFLSVYNINEGKVYLSSVSLNTGFSNFPKHAVFVPALYQIALYSSAQQIKSFYTIGNNEPIEIYGKSLANDAIYKITGQDENFEIIPEHKNIDFKTYIYNNNQITHSGNYYLTLGKDTITGIAFNYNRKESELTSYTPAELEEQITIHGLNNINLINAENKDISEIVVQKEQGKKLWKLCIILAILFLGTEIALIRFLKN